LNRALVGRVLEAVDQKALGPLGINPAKRAH
jgi:hypothetical protein